MHLTTSLYYQRVSDGNDPLSLPSSLELLFEILASGREQTSVRVDHAVMDLERDVAVRPLL